MEAMWQSWTEERLHDFRGDVSRRFDEVDKRFDKVEGRIDGLESDVKRGFELMNRRFEAIDQRLHSMQRTMLQSNAVFFAALIGLLGTLVLKS